MRVVDWVGWVPGRLEEGCAPAMTPNTDKVYQIRLVQYMDPRPNLAGATSMCKGSFVLVCSRKLRQGEMKRWYLMAS